MLYIRGKSETHVSVSSLKAFGTKVCVSVSD